MMDTIDVLIKFPVIVSGNRSWIISKIAFYFLSEALRV